MNKIVSTHDNPGKLANELSRKYAQSVTAKHKKDNGQFFTPKEIADYIAGLSNIDKETISILDPGFGTGILTSAIIEKIREKGNAKKIHVVAYETDLNLIDTSKQVLNFIKHWLLKKNIKFEYELHARDFVLDNAKYLTKKIDNENAFDVVISNPPYFKIPKTDRRALLSKSIIHGQPNIYFIFMAIAANLIKDDGELLFITPRSFAAGQYFKLFREKFFSSIALNYVHIFNSRNDAFKKDKVLQENIIIKGQRLNGIIPETEISISEGIKDIHKSRKLHYRFDDLVDLKSRQKTLYLPTTEKEFEVMQLFKSWKNKLIDYNIKISTGPVVPFRNTDFLISEKKSENHVPLFWLINTKKMELIHPLTKANKPQWIEFTRKSIPVLSENKNYIFLRRFSTKDDASRLVATPYFAKNFDFRKIGIENHLNYIYRPAGELSDNELFGISALLNSKLFDTFFRTFNGNTQVSATELKEMNFPDWHIINEIGENIKNRNYKNFALIDSIVENTLNFNLSNNEQDKRSSNYSKNIRATKSSTKRDVGINPFGTLQYEGEQPLERGSEN